MPQVLLKDGRSVKLGRVRPVSLPPVPRLAAYLNYAKATMAPPKKVDYASKAHASLQRMYANDQYGNCVIAGKAHSVGVWSANDVGAPILATDDEVLREYFRICGPGDNGCIITHVLDVMRSRGLTLGGAPRKIDGYVAVNPSDKLQVQIALYLFGSLCLGVNLPSAWTCTDCDWLPTDSRIIGGHDVSAVGYDERGVQVSTWGGIATITWEAFTSSRWVEECYAMLSPDWYNADELGPHGINVAALKLDIEKLQNGETPTLPDDPTPPPPAPAPPSPIPSILTIRVPQQPVRGGLLGGFYVPAFTVEAEIRQGELAQTAAVPPWLMALLRVVCAAAPQLGPPYGPLVQLLCTMLAGSSSGKPCGCRESTT